IDLLRGLMMGRGFEVQGSQQLPVWTIAQVDHRHMQPRVDERRSHRMPQVVKPGVWLPSSQGWTSVAFLDGAVSQIRRILSGFNRFSHAVRFVMLFVRHRHWYDRNENYAPGRV